jgi:hypothetical protein
MRFSYDLVKKELILSKTWAFDGKNPSYQELAKILRKYDIHSKQALEKYLSRTISQDSDTGGYLNWCHKLTWLYEKKFQKDYGSKNKFAKEIETRIFDHIIHTKKSKLIEELGLRDNDEITLDMVKASRKEKVINRQGISKTFGFKSSDNLLQVMKVTSDGSEDKSYCKKFKSTYDVDNEIQKEQHFLDNFCGCFNVSLNFFENYYTQKKIDSESLDNIEPSFKPLIGRSSLDYKLQEELKKFLNLSKEQLKTQIQKIEIGDYPDEYYLLVLTNSFSKEVESETLLLYIDKLTNRINPKNTILVFHKAKLLSNLKREKEAIECLKEFEKYITEQSLSLSQKDENELHNLLAASYKRSYFKDGEDEDLRQALDLYNKAFEDSKKKDFYPLLNIAYLRRISNNFDRNLFKNLWDDINSEETWWYKISEVEFWMLMSEPDTVNKKIDALPNIKKISRYQIKTAIRQIDEIYRENAPEDDIPMINNLIIKLKNLYKDSNIGADGD